MVQFSSGNGHHTEEYGVVAFIRDILLCLWWGGLALVLVGTGIWLITNPPWGAIVVVNVMLPIGVLWVLVRVVRSAWKD